MIDHKQLLLKYIAHVLECEGADAVHALITVAGNPVLSVPNGKRIDAALPKLDFIVALDIYINETTRHADYILPSTTQLEHSNYDFLFAAFAQRNFARYSPRVFQPDDDSRDQYELFLELLARLHGMQADDLRALMLEGLIDTVLKAPALAHLDADLVWNASSLHSPDQAVRSVDLFARPEVIADVPANLEHRQGSLHAGLEVDLRHPALSH